MRISDVTNTPLLRQIGVNYQVRTQVSVGEAPASLAPQESFELSDLDPNAVQAVYAASQGSAPVAVDPLNRQSLLQALQQVGQQVNLQNALAVQAAAAEIIASIRSQGGSVGQTLSIQGAFGQIELDLEKLQPERLRAAFAAQLGVQSPGSLIANFQAVSSLTQQIRSEFAPTDFGRVSQLLGIAQSPRFEIQNLVTAAFGFNALNQGASVAALQAGLTAVPDDAVKKLQAELAEKVQRLVNQANLLAETLEINPNLEAPDVGELIHSFLLIFAQLDADLNAIVDAQIKAKNFERKILAEFAAALQRSLSLKPQDREKLDTSYTERIKWVIEQQLQAIKSRLGVISQTPLSAGLEHLQPDLLQALEQLNQRHAVYS